MNKKDLLKHYTLAIYIQKRYDKQQNNYNRSQQHYNYVHKTKQVRGCNVEMLR